MVNWLSKHQSIVVACIVLIGIIYFLYAVQQNINEQTMQDKARKALIDINATRDIEEALQVGYELTREYINSDEYLENYQRAELSKQLEGEQRVVISEEYVPAENIMTPVPTPNYSEDVKAWQLWWQLLSDQPIPIE